MQGRLYSSFSSDSTFLVVEGIPGPWQYSEHFIKSFVHNVKGLRETKPLPIFNISLQMTNPKHEVIDEPLQRNTIIQYA